jgi:hypothetical protein
VPWPFLELPDSVTVTALTVTSIDGELGTLVIGEGLGVRALQSGKPFGDEVDLVADVTTDDDRLIAAPTGARHVARVVPPARHGRRTA